MAETKLMVIRGLSFRAGPRGLVAVVGPSGSGKTSLLRVLLGLQEPDAGIVVVLGHVPWSEPQKVRPRIGYMSQEGLLIPWLTVRENIELYLSGRGARPGEHWSRVESIAERLGLAKLLDKRPGQLSGGEARRAELLLALSHPVPLYLLDEPTAMVDRETATEVRDVLVEVARESLVLAATHDPLIMEAADKIIDLSQHTHLAESKK